MQRYDSAREEIVLRTENRAEAENKGVQTEEKNEGTRWIIRKEKTVDVTPERYTNGSSNCQIPTCTNINKFKCFYSNSDT